METLSPPSSADAPCLVFLMLLDGSQHDCGWDLVLSGPTVGAKCSCRNRLPLTSEADDDSSYFLWFLFSPQVIESGSVETEGTLPVDCTTTIRSVLG